MNNTGQKLYKKAKKLIPGGTQLLSKRPEMLLPDLWPAYFEKTDGCYVWDMDGNKYVDVSYMSLGASTLGYNDEDVDKAVVDVVKKGNISTLNPHEEVELAEKLIELHPWSSKARFTRSGGEAISVAVRIARAKSNKDIVLFSGYHGWHDWYLSSNLADDKSLDGHLMSGLSPKGVPRNLKGTSYPFKFNDTEGFLELLNKYGDNVGVIVMETIRNGHPTKKFLDTIKLEAEKRNIVIVVDEITSGFRFNIGGAHLNYDFIPNIAVFGKALSNGYPMAAIIGDEATMSVAEDTFISSTYWTDRIGPASALACLKKMEKVNLPKRLEETGKRVQEIWIEKSKKHDINIEIGGSFPLNKFVFKYDNSLELKTLFTQFMLEEGYLATTAFYSSYKHNADILSKYEEAINKVFSKIAMAIKNSSVLDLLIGPVCHSGFKRLN